MVRESNDCVRRLLGLPDPRPSRVADQRGRHRPHTPVEPCARRSRSPPTPRGRSPSVDSESEIMPDFRAAVIQQGRALMQNWDSGAWGPTGWPPIALTAADRAALDVRARRGGVALGVSAVDEGAGLATLRAGCRWQPVGGGAAVDGAANADGDTGPAGASASATDGGAGGQRHIEETGMPSASAANAGAQAHQPARSSVADCAVVGGSDSEDIDLHAAPAGCRPRGRGGRRAAGRLSDQRPRGRAGRNPGSQRAGAR